ncbi:isoprenyl transferase [Nocardioides sp. zg-1230]|nr:isoprenyl transferase [Nocardioides sp. zg-1230]
MPGSPCQRKYPDRCEVRSRLHRVTGHTALRRYDRWVVNVKDAVRRVLYPAYESRVVKFLPHDQIPKHVGVMLDGNRRWAKAVGLNTAEGYQAGADNIRPLLGWCEEVGVEVVTLWLLSSDNLTNRPPEQLTGLLKIIEGAVESLAEARRWRIHPVGALDLLPTETAERLKAAEEATRDIDGLLVNVAVGYGGRREIADAVRALLADHATKGTSLEELADIIDVEHIAEHLYTKGQPDPDLVIRTSGEQRLGGFLLWQSANSEFYFCEALWPDFRRVDFLRAIRAYAERERRFGG